MMHTSEVTGRPGITWISKVFNQVCVYKDCISTTLFNFFAKLFAVSVACKNKTANRFKTPKIQLRKRGFVLNRPLMALSFEDYSHFSSQVWGNKITNTLQHSLHQHRFCSLFFIKVLFNGNNRWVFSVGFRNDHPSTSLSRQVSLINTMCSLGWITEHLFICNCWCCFLTTLQNHCRRADCTFCFNLTMHFVLTFVSVPI